MMTSTRNFVVVSLSVLIVGVGAALVAYYTGLPTSAFSQQERLDELQLVPRDATLVAYASVADLMASDIRQRIRRFLPLSEDAQRELERQTGINIETDVEYVVACAAPSPAGTEAQPSGLVFARGRFDEAKVEAGLRQSGASVESYAGRQLLTLDRRADAGPPSAQGAVPTPREVVALAFIEPGLLAVGSVHLVRGAINLTRGGSSVTNNQEMMEHVRSLGDGNVWAVGRFDALAPHARLPLAMVGQLPSITWFTLSGSVDAGVRGTLKAETRDEEAATQLRDVVRGLIALLKLQVSTSGPEMQTLLDSLKLDGVGTTVALSFELPAVVLDRVAPGADERRGP